MVVAMAKRFIGLLVLSALAPFLIGVSYAADKIALACSGIETSGLRWHSVTT